MKRFALFFGWTFFTCHAGHSLSVRTASGTSPFSVEIGGKLLFNAITGTSKEYGSGSDCNSSGARCCPYVFTGEFLRELVANGTRLERYSNSMFVLDSSRVDLKASKAMKGYILSLCFRFLGDASASKPVKEAYIRIDHNRLGIIRLGNTVGPMRDLGQGPYFGIGSGGTDGSFPRLVPMTTACAAIPGSLGDMKEATKIVYFSPFFDLNCGGVQFGLGFTPRSQHYGEDDVGTGFSSLKKGFKPQYFNVTEMVACYQWRKNDVSLALSCGLIMGQTKAERPDIPLLERFKHLKTSNVGFKLSVGPWALAAEYSYSGKSGYLANNLPVTIPTVDKVQWEPRYYLAQKGGKQWWVHVGAAYSTDAGGVSFTCLYTTKNTGFVDAANDFSPKAIGRAYVVSTQYNLLTPGIAAYLECAIYRMKNPSWAYLGTAISSLTKWEYMAIPSNKSEAILAGIKVQF